MFNGEGMAPLHLAAKGGHMGAVAFLLQRKSFVDMQDFDVSWEVLRDVKSGKDILEDRAVRLWRCWAWM